MKQTESKMNQNIEEMNNEIEMRRIKLLIQDSERGRHHENYQMALEDEASNVVRVEAKLAIEV